MNLADGIRGFIPWKVSIKICVITIKKSLHCIDGQSLERGPTWLGKKVIHSRSIWVKRSCFCDVLSDHLFSLIS